jgi:hypothetical protein
VLGAIGGQHSILPRKPQLSSSRAVDIDMMSTRPWSAVSNEEVIDEQHQLIHKVYMAAKLVCLNYTAKLLLVQNLVPIAWLFFVS